MYKLYLYTRDRLFIHPFQRDEFRKLFIKRCLKSVARSTGKRIHLNTWMRLIDHLYWGNPDHAEQFINDLTTGMESFERTHKQSCLRIKLMINVIKLSHVDSASSAYRQLFNEFEPKFQEQGQSEWIVEVAEKLGFNKLACGHWEKYGRAVLVQGNAETVHEETSCCRICSRELQDSGERVVDFQGSLILASFSAEVHGNHNRTYIADRRASNISFNERHQIWVDSYWSPYSDLINSYHSSRSIGFKVIDSPWFRSHRRAFGCELEVEVKSGDANAAAGRVHELVNPSLRVGEYCFFERDASIGTGFEMVTQPAGLDVHREKFALFLNNPEVKRGMRSHEGGRCGFHVHVGRDYLTQSQIYRIQSFLNDVRNEALIRSIARRYETGYCKYKPHMAKFSPHGKNNGDRYESLNVCNAETIEFRIFRGSLRYESIIAALEFVNAVLTFCTPGVTSIMDFNAIGFKKFLMLPDNRADTKYLRSYLSLDATSDNERLAA